MRIPPIVFRGACAVLLVASLTAPAAWAQSRRPTVLLSEYNDADVGREASAEVESQIGVLSDDDLNAYVDGIGRKLLRAVPRRSFRYHFRVVDQIPPNAFALPGGYVFLSRGLLALANAKDRP